MTFHAVALIKFILRDTMEDESGGSVESAPYPVWGPQKIFEIIDTHFYILVLFGMISIQKDTLTSCILLGENRGVIASLPGDGCL